MSGGCCAHPDVGHHHHADAHATIGERRTRLVIALSGATMVAELVTGWLSGSMALTADGWHMGTHVGAMGLACVAYWYARRAQRRGHLAFGPGKVHALAGFSNALILAGAALLLGAESIGRLFRPERIDYWEALPVAVIGLAVNVVSARMLDVHDERHDHNLRAVYLHVIADVLTSVLGIAALLLGKLAGWGFADPLMGVVGALVILAWSFGLLRSTAGDLVDIVSEPELRAKVLERLETQTGARVEDLRVWPVGGGAHGCIVRLAAPTPEPVDRYRAVIEAVAPFAHVAVEVVALATAQRAAVSQSSQRPET
jgi:cation diffusion facilitator family transporter